MWPTRNDKGTLYNTIVVLLKSRHLQSVEGMAPIGRWTYRLSDVGGIELVHWGVVDVPGHLIDGYCCLAVELNS